LSQAKERQIYKVKYRIKKNLSDKLAVGLSSGVSKAGVSIALEYAFTHWFAITGEAVYKSMNWFDRSESETAANVNFEFRF
jgi:hypothetical protein